MNSHQTPHLDHSELLVSLRASRLAELLHPIVLEDIENIIIQTPQLQLLSGKSLCITGAGGLLASYLAYCAVAWNELGEGEPCRIYLVTRRDHKDYWRLRPLSDIPDVVFTVMDCSKASPPVLDPLNFFIYAASLASPNQYLTNPLDTALTNVIGLNAMLSHARATGLESALFFSSGQIYGSPSQENIPTPETYLAPADPTAIRACYDESKRFGETLCSIYHHQFGLPVKIVRPVQIYGPGIASYDSRAFAEFLIAAASHRPLIMRSRGTARRSYCYLSDATTAFWNVLFDGAQGEAYNVGNSSPLVTIEELAHRVAAIPTPHTNNYAYRSPGYAS